MEAKKYRKGPGTRHPYKITTSRYVPGISFYCRRIYNTSKYMCVRKNKTMYHIIKIPWNSFHVRIQQYYDRIIPGTFKKGKERNSNET